MELIIADVPLIDRAVPGLAGTSFLSAIALFGPNAAGKSTLFSAISTLRARRARPPSVNANLRFTF